MNASDLVKAVGLFGRPKTTPETITISRRDMEDIRLVAKLYVSAREDIQRAIHLLEIGRTGKAAEVLRDLAKRMA